MLGDQLCNRVAEATRKRFYEDGDVPTPHLKSRRSSKLVVTLEYVCRI
jgi:hypothetical protein